MTSGGRRSRNSAPAAPGCSSRRWKNGSCFWTWRGGMSVSGTDAALSIAGTAPHWAIFWRDNTGTLPACRCQPKSPHLGARKASCPAPDEPNRRRWRPSSHRQHVGVRPEAVCLNVSALSSTSPPRSQHRPTDAPLAFVVGTGAECGRPRSDPPTADRTGVNPMKTYVGQVRSFLPYSDATIAGTCGKLRAIAGHFESDPAGAPSRFGLVIGPFGL